MSYGKMPYLSDSFLSELIIQRDGVNFSFREHLREPEKDPLTVFNNITVLCNNLADFHPQSFLLQPLDELRQYTLLEGVKQLQK